MAIYASAFDGSLGPSMTTTPDLDAIESRLIRIESSLIRLADPDWRLWDDAKALLDLVRTQQQRIAELEAELKRESKISADLAKQADWLMKDAVKP